jgi:hypothetical protein
MDDVVDASRGLIGTRFRGFSGSYGVGSEAAVIDSALKVPLFHFSVSAI